MVSAGNIEWFKLYPDFTRANPQAALIEAVERAPSRLSHRVGADGRYFAKSAPVPLDVEPVPYREERLIPLAFDISMGVRHGDTLLLQQLNEVIHRQREAIHHLLKTYGVPLPGERGSTKSRSEGNRYVDAIQMACSACPGCNHRSVPANPRKLLRQEQLRR